MCIYELPKQKRIKQRHDKRKHATAAAGHLSSQILPLSSQKKVKLEWDKDSVYKYCMGKCVSKKYVCRYVCTYVRTDACMHACMYVFMYVCNVYVYAYVYMYMYMCMYVYVCMYVGM